MIRPALTVHHGSGRETLARKHAIPRVRPGERPVAVNSNLDPAQLRQLRRRAHARGLGVDAYAAILLEYEGLTAVVSIDVLEALAVDGTRGVAEQIGAPELRSWQRLLAGRSTPPPDDLPTIMVPLRLVTAIPPLDRLAALDRALGLDEGLAQHAITLESRAAAAGLVMQAWVLSQIVASASGGAAASF
jgi:hypothetical protein